MKTTIHAGILALIAAVVVLLTGCGAASDGPTSPDVVPTGPAVTLSGTATFERVPITSTGLNYAGIIDEPIRGAVVEIRSESGRTVLTRGNTDENGNFSLSSPSGGTVLVTVLAALGSPTDPGTVVVNNQAGFAIYSVYKPVVVTEVAQSGIQVEADSGWTGSSYGATRAAGPFAILDIAYRIRTMLMAADGGLTMDTKDLIIYWSKDNKSSGSRPENIGTSYYSPSQNRLYLLGKANEDTDEYDTHVVAHEIAHWFEHNFSRSDSMGGPHGASSILDESVAFGEGFGNAFSGMVMRDPVYRDSTSSSQATIGVLLNVESDSQSDSTTVSGSDTRKRDGSWSESSVQEILYDCFDGGDGTTDGDADGVSLGFTPIYNVLVGGQRTTKGFTSVHSFLSLLRTANAGSSAAITALANNENIGTFDEYQQTDVGRKRYTVVPGDGIFVEEDVDFVPITTYDTYGDFYRPREQGNKLYNWMYFAATAPLANTNYTFLLWPLPGSNTMVINQGADRSPGEIHRAGPQVSVPGPGNVEVTVRSTVANQMFRFRVSSYVNDVNESGVSQFKVKFSPTSNPVSTKPSSYTQDIPNGNG